MSDGLTLDVVSITDETADIKTFVFRPRGGVPSYRAGQALTLALAIDGETLHRTFSLASAPGGETLSLTIKAQEKGRATRWLHERLSVGDAIEARGPRGRFTIEDRETDRIALVSAGSGASPLMAMLRHLAAAEPAIDLHWFHAARTPADILFERELAALQVAMPRLKVTIAVSRPAPGWFGFAGRISRRMLSVAVPDYGRREVFCCGPDGFMEEARLIHAAEGGTRGHFRVEHFGARPKPEPAALAADAPEAGFAISLGDRRFAARAGETLLEAATRQAIVIPCGCASGLCGTCRVSLVSGEVAMAHEGGISPEEEAQGYILACSSRPRSDVTIAL